jgi:hypothetical protein
MSDRGEFMIWLGFALPFDKLRDRLNPTYNFPMINTIEVQNQTECHFDERNEEKSNSKIPRPDGLGMTEEDFFRFRHVLPYGMLRFTTQSTSSGTSSTQPTTMLCWVSHKTLNPTYENQFLG